MRLGKGQLVVRRGMPFNLTLHVKPTMHVSPESSKDLLKDKSLTAKLGKPWLRVYYYDPSLYWFNLFKRDPVPKGLSPNEESNPLLTFPLHQLTDETQWGAVASSGPAENTILVSLTMPPDAPIGQYTLTLQQPDNEDLSLGEFTLLFNPWCSSKCLPTLLAQQACWLKAIK